MLKSTISFPQRVHPDQIAFDIDGVVADTMGAFIKVANAEFGIDYLEKEQITDYWLEKCLPIPEETTLAIIDRLLKDPFGVGLMPIKGARQCLERLAVRSNSLTFVTARPVRQPILDWLLSLLKGIPEDMINVIATGQHTAKPEVLKELGTKIFVEDHLETCEALCDNGIGAVVFDQPWNRQRTPFLRVSSWQEIMQLIKLP